MNVPKIIVNLSPIFFSIVVAKRLLIVIVIVNTIEVKYPCCKSNVLNN